MDENPELETAKDIAFLAMLEKVKGTRVYATDLIVSEFAEAVVDALHEAGVYFPEGLKSPYGE